MGMVSGQYGEVHVGASELLTADGWTLDLKASVSKRAYANTGGYKEAVAGTREGSGTIKGIFDPADPADDHIDVGTSVSLKLYVSATKYYSVTAIISSFKVDTDMNDGKEVGWEAAFEVSGAWSFT